MAVEVKNFNTYINEVTFVDLSDTIHGLLKLKPKIIGKKLTPIRLAKLIGDTLNTEYSAFKSAEVPRNMISIVAYYDQYADEDGDEPIEIVTVYNPEDTHLVLTKDFFKWLYNELSDAISHEQIHQQQARKRDFVVATEYFDKSLNKEQRYYAKPDEVEAFAWNAANELKRSSKSNALNMLKRPSMITIKESSTIKKYMDEFGSSDHPVIKKFLSKVFEYLTQLK
jgi:hypothetical protein